MKHRWIALLLVLCLSLGMIGSVSAADDSFEDSVDLDLLVAAGIQMYQNVEAHYDTVANDSGAVGMGIMAWRAVKALQLLKRICAADPALSRETLGDALYQEVLTTDEAVYNANGRWIDYGWHYRLFTPEEIAAAKSLISTEIGIAAQNTQAKEDITAQVKNGWARGIRSDAALLYYSYAENHYGSGGVRVYLAAVRKALGLGEGELITSLEQFHAGTVATAYCSEDVNGKCNCARSRCYRFIKNDLDWDAGTPVLLTQPVHVCPCSSFVDMPAEHNWAHAGIDFVVEEGLFNGTSATRFSPDGTMTRAMMVTVLYRLAGEPAVDGISCFRDVKPGAYYEAPVIWATQNAIVNGSSFTRFDPEGKVTREQIATFLFRYAQYTGVAGSLKTQELTGFKDVAKVSSFAYYAMIWATQNDLVRGTGGYLNPQAPATRAEVAAIYMRFCNQFN